MSGRAPVTAIKPAQREPLVAPAATARGAASFYADQHFAAPVDRRCRGLSCRLAAAGDMPVTEQPVYCLGYCDQSPVRLTAAGVVLSGLDGQTPLPPDVRCAARRPVVTERLLHGDGNAADLPVATAAGVYATLTDWVQHRQPAELLDVISASGERGRGGAGFPTGDKWRACAAADGPGKVVVANGDEGDPGSYIDRLLMEHDPHAVIEGLALCAFAVGASRGLVFVRSEYPQARLRIEQAVADATAAGLLAGADGGGLFDFTVEVIAGHGSYVCGEETALLNAIEGRRGEVRVRPPYPVEQGLYGLPTVVNNVETLVNIPWIARHGAAAYRALGTATEPGTKVLCLNHGFGRPGPVEVDFGISLREVIETLGDGGADGRAIEAVVLGGPMGSVLTADRWDVPVGYASMHAQGIELGHGGLVALPAGTDYRSVLIDWLQFMADESCGRCVACRSGSQRALALAADPVRHRAELEGLLDTIVAGSLCAFGRNIPRPVRELLQQIDKP